MQLNCDLGEDFGAWRMPVNEAIMQLINQANVACGFHAGDPTAILNTIRLSKQHNLSIGAHPSYPDLVGFGRRHIAMSADDLYATLCYQISAVKGMCALSGATLDYVKPHGALYNDCIKHPDIRRVVMKAVSQFEGLTLMIQAVPEYTQFVSEANVFGLTLQFEAFVDRRYSESGSLVPRQQSGAVLNIDEALQQAKLLIQSKQVKTLAGNLLDVNASTLCLHGDNPDSLELAKSIAQLLASTE